MATETSDRKANVKGGKSRTGKRAESGRKPEPSKLARQTDASERIGCIWNDLLERIGERKFDKWFAKASLSIKGRTLHVAAQSRFVATWIDRHFIEELRASAAAHVGSNATISVAVKDDPCDQDATLPVSASGAQSHARARVQPEEFDEPSSPRSRRGRKSPSDGASTTAPDTRIGAFRRLQDLIVGQSNQLAFATAEQFASDPEASRISPLFIHGECGVGKTHILQGIHQRFIDTSGRPERARYMTGEHFTNEFITAVKAGTLDAFRRRTRKLDLLIVDDVHFLTNKMRTQSEFLHTLDAIDLAGARVVLASDSNPRNIGSFRQALISRFMSGMVVQIERPQRDLRKQLIEAFAKRRGLRINEAAAELIAAHCVGSVRELEGTIIKLSALHMLASSTAGPEGEREEVGVVLARQLFEDHGWQPSSPVRMSTITEMICERLGVDRGDLLGSRRHRRVVLARALVAHLGREMTTHSYPEIAQSLGRTYHSTVHTAAQRLRRQLEANESIDLGNGDRNIRLRELVDQLRHGILKASSSR